ncbi:MAG: HD domain-containing protein [Candidatus Taylorbacteria bacterium]|nr:HD domain-containing protein [Candidatus Taylorbacteria bacterium]
MKTVEESMGLNQASGNQIEARKEHEEMAPLALSPTISRAIRFATKTHEIYQKQRRKGKDIPYITHPLVVGLILARAGASEDVVAAGILHDTIEDSIPEKKVSSAMLSERFGEAVSQLVESVSESDKTLPWEERKREALEHIKSFSHEALLVKSADTLGNVSELIDDFERDGDTAFANFNAPKEKIIENYLNIASAILAQWEENPLRPDLQNIATSLEQIKNAGVE